MTKYILISQLTQEISQNEFHVDFAIYSGTSLLIITPGYHPIDNLEPCIYSSNNKYRNTDLIISVARYIYSMHSFTFTMHYTVL